MFYTETVDLRFVWGGNEHCGEAVEALEKVVQKLKEMESNLKIEWDTEDMWDGRITFTTFDRAVAEKHGMEAHDLKAEAREMRELELITDEEYQDMSSCWNHE